VIERPDQLVVDASIVGRWYLGNPPYVVEADKVWQDYRADKIALVAPTNLRMEVAGAISRSLVQRTHPPEQVRGLLSEFLTLELPLVGDSELILEAHDLSVRLSASFFDSLYLALAQSLQIPFVHADRRLRDSLRGRFRWELWIEEYS